MDIQQSKVFKMYLTSYAFFNGKNEHVTLTQAQYLVLFLDP